MDRKHLLIDSNFQPKKCAKRCLGSYDPISELPDEILIDILSLLSLKEAARTSILSSRWMNLWKHTPSLNFDGQSALENNIAKQDGTLREAIESEGLKYVNWVDSVVQSHKSPTLKEFILRFSLDITAKNSITQWLEFAFSRQVQSLKLDFSGYSNLPNYYCFPEELLALSSCTAPNLPVELKSLKELSLRSVHLSDGVIESFLRNCPSLERLVISQTNKISKVEVCGPSLKLKHLGIIHCTGLKSLKVSVPNLTSLRVTKSEGLLLECVPMLVELSIGCSYYYDSVEHLISTLSCCASQLEILRLMLSKNSLIGLEAVGLNKFTELPKLKTLVVEYILGQGQENLVWLTALIRASPFLEEFVLNYKWYKLPKKDREVKDPTTSPHHHLKVFKFNGYYGRTNDAELLGYIIKNCIELQKIVIDSSGGEYPETEKYDVKRNARKNAEQLLQPLVPQHVELVIL